MPSITIKNIPDQLYNRIKNNASKNFRSINSEILFCLNQSFSPKEIDAEKLIARVEEMQSKYGDLHLTDKILDESKNLGRK